MTNRQMILISIGGALLVVAIVALGLLSLREACRDFHQATLMVDNKPYSVALAQDDIDKTRGLMGCSSVPQNAGMYFVYTQPTEATFWMKGMSIPIDIVWVARGKVVGIERNVPPVDKMMVDPAMYKSGRLVDGVFEIGANKAAEYNIKLGSVVTLITK